MKYVVTGGAGFIGNNFVRLLLELNHEVKVIDNLHTGRIENLADIKDKIEFEDVDIKNFEKMELSLRDVDGIFHEAALTSVSESFKKYQEYYNVNVIGTKNIFKIANKENIRVIFASSSSVYGNVKKTPIKENFEKKPNNPYGQTKLDSEYLASEFIKKRSKIIGLRYFNVYGIGQNNSYAGVITKFLENIKNEKSIIINGDGKQNRDFIHVKDIAKANINAMESKVENGFFNIGTGIATSINDLSKIMINLSNHKYKTIHGSQLAGDVEKSQADIRLSKRVLNWNHEINLIEGLKELISLTL